MIDVIPLGQGAWLARCECGATERFPTAEAGWDWVLGHPCPTEAESVGVVDLNERTQTGCQ